MRETKFPNEDRPRLRRVSFRARVVVVTCHFAHAVGLGRLEEAGEAVLGVEQT